MKFLLREELCQGHVVRKNPGIYKEVQKAKISVVAHDLGKVGTGPFGWNIMGHAKGILLFS